MKKAKFKSFAFRSWVATTIVMIAVAALIYLLYTRVLLENGFVMRECDLMFAVCGVFIIVNFIMALVTKKSFSRPMGLLQKHMNRISKKEWCPPLDVRRSDEIGQLAESINSMQASLKRADQQEKDFFHNISHDLKTPAMVIMSHADAIIDDIHVESPEATAQVIKDEARRLTKMINQLLYYGTLDHVLETGVSTTVLDFDKLVMNIVGKFETLGSHLTCDDSHIERMQIRTNDHKLTVAIENIWDNAIRHAQTRVSVTLRRIRNTARLEIFNDGKQVSPDSLEKFFDNMYKGEKGGFGLGLPITKKIITFFGGKVWAENRENGIVFIIEYPVV